MQTGICKREVRHRRYPLRHMTMTVAVVRRQRVQLERVVLQVELQVLFLALVEQRIPTLRENEHLRNRIARVWLDGRIRFDHAVGRQLLQEIIDLRVLDRLRNPLRLHAHRTYER